MRLFHRQDTLLLVGLAAALLIIFSRPISRLLDFIRELEQQTGLTLLASLVVLTVVYLFHLLRRRSQSVAQVAAAEAGKAEAERRTVELERLAAFGQALARAPDQASIRAAVEQHVPIIAGCSQIWLVVRQGTQWTALTGDTRAADEILAHQDFADHLAQGSSTGHVRIGHNIGFPMIVGGTAVGVLGVNPQDSPLDPERRRVVEASSAFLAISLKNEQLFREVRENSMRDGVTGCWNRTYASEIFQAELRRARRSAMPISLVMFDLDRFKEINDRQGHLCGDAVLAAVGRRMREALRVSDLKCRYGGDEFLVALPETALNGATRVAETLRREMADRPVPWAGQELAVTASFGVTQALPGEMDIKLILARADAALYQAKKDGRNCVRALEHNVPEFVAHSRRHND